MGSGPDHPTLLPARLIADPDADAGKTPRTTRDWLVDAACFLAAAGLGGLVFLNMRIWQQVPAPFLIVDVAVGGVGCLALWWRRRWPVTIAVLLALCSAAFSLAAGAAVVALFTVAVHRRGTAVIPVAVLNLLVTLPYYVLYEDPAFPYWGSIAFATAIIAVVTAWGMMVRARRQLVLSLRDRAYRAEAEQQLRAEQARRAERTRIAREMHDVLAHRISLLSTYAGALEFRSDASPEEVARAAGVMRDSAHQALQDLREVIGVLREDANGAEREYPQRPQPTLADLPDLIEESRRAGLRVTWESRLQDMVEVPDSVGRNGYRIVQEGLTNARKHAEGAAVTVTVDGRRGRGLTVEVRNPLPVGTDVAAHLPGAGSGLVGLAERANLAGGRLQHGRTPDDEFRLRAWLPWPA